jgi:hypothetical protein
MDEQVYKGLHPGLAVRVYFMVYQMTTEEHKYLASLRKEKEAFERLIKERGVSTQPLTGAMLPNFPRRCCSPFMKSNVLPPTWEKLSSRPSVLALLEEGKSSPQKNHE